MELEAWGLIRLFFDENRISFIKGGEDADVPPGSMLLTLGCAEDDHERVIRTCLFRGIDDPEGMEAALSGGVEPDFTDVSRTPHGDMSKAGGFLLKSVKIACGASLYRVLSRAFGRELPYGSLIGVHPVKLAASCLDDGLDPDRAASLLEDATRMSPEKARLLVSIATTERRHTLDNEGYVNIYVGVPFCESRCLYCSFASYPIDRMRSLVTPYIDALLREIEFGLELISRYKLKVNAVYLGGGTPTALPENELSRLLQAIRDGFPFREFTVEAGRPDSLTIEKLHIIKECGATRISINPQSMNRETLELIGRSHTPEEIIEKYNLARALGFDNINMDIIAGLPGEGIEEFRSTLSGIEALRPDSLTVHTMAVKRASRLHSERESFRSTDDATVERMIAAAGETAARMGMAPYYLYRQKNMLANLENTGYVIPGKECLYNIHTMAEKQNILAFGAGAVSKVVNSRRNTISRDDNVRDIGMYIRDIAEMMERKRRLFEKLSTGFDFS